MILNKLAAGASYRVLAGGYNISKATIQNRKKWLEKKVVTTRKSKIDQANEAERAYFLEQLQGCQQEISMFDFYQN
ncbi:hypothetical protein [Neisseria iguanae]|uniref:Transposase n=1 Tax=Neisseria iguanae TaxID=90242 RepID=A0A2P7TZF4_9NEIS|nr:hypothetical protein [Neisseria iguanae]PSJ80071.1 hypothetical protein C7N83_08460 [Neisseria iguanae]